MDDFLPLSQEISNYIEDSQMKEENHPLLKYVFKALML